MPNIQKITIKAINHYKNGDFKSALELFKETLTSKNKTELPNSYYNIGLCYFSMMQYKESEKAFEKSFEYYKNLNCGYELSLSLLFNNKLEEGLNLYHFRYYNHRQSFPNLPIKQTRNIDDLYNKNVLVLNEQGFGDEILFSRNIDKLHTIVKICKYQVYDKMIELFNHNFDYNNIEFFDNRSLSFEFVSKFDTWITTGDLFSSYILKYGLDYKEFKSNVLVNKNKTFGLTWFANVQSGNSKKRSIDLSNFKDILSNFNVISLQKDNIEDWMVYHDISDFKKTSDVIDMCDYVITVDTVTAHLSAVKNKPTILVYKDYLDWRWNYNFYKNITLVKIDNLDDYIKSLVNIK